MLPRKWLLSGMAVLGAMAVSVAFAGTTVTTASGAAGFKSTGAVQSAEVKLSFESGGRIVRLQVSEGATVKAGQVVAQLDDYLYQHQLRQAEINLKAAKARLEQAEKEYQSTKALLEQQVALAAANERAATIQLEKDPVLAEAQWKAAVANLNVARDRADNNTLEASARILDQQVQAAAATSDSARVQWEKSRLMLAVQLDQAVINRKAAQEKLSQLLETFPIQKRLLEEQVALAEVGLSSVKAQLAKLTLTAPVSGIISVKTAQEGEVIGAGHPVALLRSTDELWVRIYVSEEHLSRLKLGRQAAITSPALPDRTYQGSVSFIGSSPEFTPKNVTTAADVRTNVYPVHVRILTPGTEWKAGMTGTVQFTD